MLNHIRFSVLLGLSLWLSVWAQPPLATPAAEPTPTPIQVSASPEATTLTELAGQVESSREQLKQVESQLAQEAIPPNIAGGLEILGEQMSQALNSLKLVMAQARSVGELREQEVRFRNLAAPLAGWKKQLKARAGSLDEASRTLDQMEKIWADRRLSDLPAEFVEGVSGLIERYRSLRQKIKEDRALLLVALDRINSLEEQTRDTLDEIAHNRDQRVNQLFIQDSPPVWQMDFGSLSWIGVRDDLGQSLVEQYQAVLLYLGNHLERALMQLVVVGLLILALIRAAAKVAPWVKLEPGLERPATVFSRPYSTGLLLACVLSPIAYPECPPLLNSALRLLVIVPASVLLSRLLDPAYLNSLKLLFLLFFVDQSRAILASQAELNRLMMTFEVTLLTLFMLVRMSTGPKTVNAARLRLITLSLAGFAWLAMNLGFVNLGFLVGQGVIGSLVAGVLLLALVQVLDGLILLALRLPPLSLLNSVRQFCPQYLEGLKRATRFSAKLLWLVISLDLLALLAPVSTLLVTILTYTVHIGAVSLSLGGVLALVVCLALPYQLSRLARFQLEQDVYPRLGMSVGQTYTITLVVHYTLYTLFGLFGLAAVGIDTNKFAIVVGALGVGIGFGLQNIVNNFVSGLILLFERPIEVGDVIEVSGLVGTLQRVGLRASVLRTADGSEIIVPNGELLATKVTNWTLSDARRLLRIDIGVAYGSDLPAVQKLLGQVAEQHPEVLKEPAPSVLLQTLGDSALNLQLQAWTSNSTRWNAIRSELAISCYQALQKAEIEIPFPQRTVRLIQDEPT